MMKKNTLAYLLALLVLVGGSGCMSSVNLQVLQPAHISLPKDIQEFSLVNRYRPEKGKGVLNVLEGALTGEGIGQDRRGAESSLTGLTEALAGSPRYHVIRPNIELRGSGLATFPQPLPEAEVAQICADYKSDALVTIEAFDSDTRVDMETVVRERKDKEGNVTKYNVYIAHKFIDVVVGWRMYHQDGRILDEFMMREAVGFDAEGRSPVAARANLPNRTHMVREMGRVTGLAYSERIAPTWIWVNRNYYSKGKGNDKFKWAKSRVRAKDWEDARELWENALEEDPKEKVKGRAAYNLALYYEVMGDLETAREYARMASKYGIGQGINYENNLRRRQAEVERLNDQMEGAPE